MINSTTLKIDIKEPWNTDMQQQNNTYNSYGSIFSQLSEQDKLSIIEGFCSYLVKKVKKYLKQKINNEYLLLGTEIFTNRYAEFFTHYGVEKYNLKELLEIICDNIVWERIGDKYYITVDNTKNFPNTQMSIYELSIIIELGCQWLPAINYLRKIVLFVDEHLVAYWQTFLTRTILNMV